MGGKFIFISIIGIIAFNLIVLYIIQRNSKDRKLIDYLKKSKQ